MSLTNAAIYELRNYLNDSYYIPDYQREYSWEKDQLDDFWNDLVAVASKETNDHFLGQIVIHNENKIKYIIDGQQRTITAFILLSAMRSIFDEIYKEDNSIRNANYDSADITSIYIGREGSLHLTLSVLDKDYFEKNIQLGIPEAELKAKKASHERIRKAYYFFVDRIKTQLNSYPSLSHQYTELNNLLNAFTNKFKVLYMEATDLNEAFIIFETLNARGKDLETSDLLKNYILRKTSNSSVSLVKWNNMISNLNDIDPTKYIRHFWNSRNEFTREKMLYRKISANIDDSHSSEMFLNDLETYSAVYNDIFHPSSDISFTDNTKLIASLRALKTMKTASFYPIVLAMKQKKLNNELCSVIRTIEVYAFRNFAISNKVANTAEVFFAKLAVRIYKGELKTSEEICSIIKQEIVSDDEFKSAMRVWTAPSTNKELIRYIFRNIHSYLAKDDTKELNTNNNEVQIEHIMPQDIKLWDISPDIHKEYLWKLGNLMLLSEKLNKQAKAKPFLEKKEYYNRSKILPNNNISKYTEWNEKQIEKRQEELISYALDIWRV